MAVEVAAVDFVSNDNMQEWEEKKNGTQWNINVKILNKNCNWNDNVKF